MRGFAVFSLGDWGGSVGFADVLPGGEHLQNGLEQSVFAAGGLSIGAAAAEYDETFGYERLLTMSKLLRDEVDRVEPRVGEGFDFLPANIGFGLANLCNLRGFTLAFEFRRTSTAFG